MPRPLGSDTITILRAPLVVDPVDNSSYRDWDTAVSTPVYRCSVQPFPMAEKLNFEENRSREFSRTAIRIWCPPGTRFEPTDRILYMGETYDVFGHQGVWHRFRGQEHHVQIIARLREG